MSGNESENMPIGKCRYCGQTAIIQTVGEISQEERDIMATNKCMCPEAQSERRKKERREAIEKFVKKNFDEYMRHFIHRLVQMVTNNDLTEIAFVLPDERSVRIWLDAQAYIHIKVKKVTDDELKI